VHVRRRAGSDLSAVLEFVPINAGSFDVYCQIGVPNGNQYDAIAAGTVEPDLVNTSGHAGKGAKATATITAATTALSVTYAASALGADPRRVPTNGIWANGVRNDTYRADPIDMFEFSDEEYAFIPSNPSLSIGVGYVLRLSNSPENLRAHVFSSSDFFEDSVVREVQDDDVEVESSTLKSFQVLVGDHMEVFAVPTLAGTYVWYCDVAVQLNPDGSPRLNTGHAARGMVGSLTVVP